jgi:hypothetical membrane protein
MSDYRKHLVNKFRRLQTIVSITLFIIIFLFCWSVTDFKIVDIQLSHWGGDGVPVSPLWNSIIMILSVSTLINFILYIKHNERVKNKKIPLLFGSFVSLCLFMVGFYSVDHSFIHNLSAYLYFFLQPLLIFVLAYLNRFTLSYKEWLTHLFISIIMVLIPLIFISMFKGLAITETIHTVIVCYWNLYIAFKRD